MLKKIVPTLPTVPGVYCMVNAEGKVLYVGKARNLQKRVQSYTREEQLPHRLRQMVRHVEEVRITLTHTEVEALLLEANLIKTYHPPYNILLKDGKTMNCIVLTSHPFPLLKKQRSPHSYKYRFGPFPSSAQIEETLVALHKAFLLRSCSDTVFKNRTRPCLQYAIKRCSAPCVGKITQEEYAALVDEAVSVLKGRSQEVQKRLAEVMHQYSQQQDYEKAKIYRDRIQALTQIQAHQTIYQADLENADVLAVAHQGHKHCIQLFCFRYGAHYGGETFFLSGEGSSGEVLTAFIQQFYQTIDPPSHILLSAPIDNPKLLEEALYKEKKHLTHLMVPKRGPKKAIVDHALMNAQEALLRQQTHLLKEEKIWEEIGALFHMKSAPQRIEVYDNSHLQGTHPVSALIVATPEGFQKKAYRHVNVEGRCEDDYAMMRAVMKKRASMGKWPDLILIDGGKGHLSSVRDLIQPSVTVVALSKGPDRKNDIFHLEDGSVLNLPRESLVLYALQRMRDEAHLFAIRCHRRKRERSALTSRLEGIPGIGNKRRQALLNHFGTYKAISNAGIEDLTRVEGISRQQAQIIYDFFQKER